ncbi:MAG: hypothetical protein GY822_28550 [Deltaproteobacteria bacterium]|nr:hypothetical protein [Deltaproteobacteria bacterium]
MRLPSKSSLAKNGVASAPSFDIKSLRSDDVNEPASKQAPEQQKVAEFIKASNCAKALALVGEKGGPRQAPGPANCSLELPDRVLPNLANALLDAKFASLKPSEIPVPQDVLDQISSAKRILVVGHTPPDGDCVGSALGMMRGLKALGKEASAMVDSALPGNLRGMVKPGELMRAAELPEEPYDLVILVDVADANRIGGAKAALQNAKAVVAMDHHQIEPSRTSLGLKDETGFSSWIADEAESATYLVAGALAQLGKSQKGGLGDEAWAAVSQALVAGQLSDTADFSVPGTAHFSLCLAKHLVEKHLDGDVGGVKNQLEYEMPSAAKSALDAACGPKISSQEGITLAVMSAPTSATSAALGLGAGANILDVKGHLQDQLDATAGKNDLSVLLFQEESGVRVSVRSKKAQPAVELAEALGGGGKAHSGGAYLNVSMDEAQRSVDDFAQLFFMQEAASLRLGR